MSKKKWDEARAYLRENPDIEHIVIEICPDNEDPYNCWMIFPGTPEGKANWDAFIRDISSKAYISAVHR